MRVSIPYRQGQFLKGTIHADTEDPDKFTIQTTEEMDRLLDYCRAKEEATRHDRRDGMFHVAEVPITIYERAVAEGWDNPDGWREWLNKPENAPFRTWKGRV